MDILLAAATAAEIQPTIDFLPNNGPHRYSILITGIGSMATAWALMRQIDRSRPDLIIQAGIAGCLVGKPSGEVLAIREEILGDLGVWEDSQFRSQFDLRLTNPDEPPFLSGRLVNPYTELLTLTGLEAAAAITVNEISTRAERIHWLQQNTPAIVESMEGGALHYVGLLERVAFLQLRSVSNPIGVRDKSKWNIPVAISALNNRLRRLLKELDHHDNHILYPVKNPV